MAGADPSLLRACIAQLLAELDVYTRSKPTIAGTVRSFFDECEVTFDFSDALLVSSLTHFTPKWLDFRDVNWPIHGSLGGAEGGSQTMSPLLQGLSWPRCRPLFAAQSW